MIKFQKISIRNFMSVGNNPLEIDYTQSKTTLVIAVNGGGKSSVMMDSLSFVLYGKPYRNINKPQLVNSINDKECLVEVWFNVDRTRYQVRRGIKPMIFEIYKNGKLINQDAKALDYQKFLETNVLKMNYRTFTQVVIMGSGNYIPFMRLESWKRREFIEDILDIKIFTLMNQLLRDRIRTATESSESVLTEIKILFGKVNMQKDFIKTLEQQKSDRVTELTDHIDTLMREISSHGKDIAKLESQVEDFEKKIVDYLPLQEKLAELKLVHKRTNQNIHKVMADKEFYSKTEVCPTCHQSIEDHHREKLIEGVEEQHDKYKVALNDLLGKMTQVEGELQKVSYAQAKISELQSMIGALQSNITVSNRLLNTHQKQMTEILTNTSSIDEERKKLKGMAKEMLGLDKKKSEIDEDFRYYDVAFSLLKDSGIKTKIIRQFVPMINKLINTTLSQMDLFVSFNLDENFNETVKSRYRDTFTYESFSEGEKQRIDLALLFVFRDIARLKNSVNANIILMDEVLDSSMDSSGVDNFFEVIKSLSGSNLFVISHRPGIEDKFDRNIRLVKKNNFTVVQ